MFRVFLNEVGKLKLVIVSVLHLEFKIVYIKRAAELWDFMLFMKDQPFQAWPTS